MFMLVFQLPDLFRNACFVIKNCSRPLHCPFFFRRGPCIWCGTFEFTICASSPDLRACVWTRPYCSSFLGLIVLNSWLTLIIAFTWRSGISMFYILAQETIVTLWTVNKQHNDLTVIERECRDAYLMSLSCEIWRFSCLGNFILFVLCSRSTNIDQVVPYLSWDVQYLH